MITNDPTAQRMIEQHDPDAAISAAMARLEASRQGMRQVMIPPRRARPPRAERAATAGGEGLAGLLAWLPARFHEWVDQASHLLNKNAVSSLLLDAVTGWWQRHPMRAVAGMAGAEVSDAVAPLIRRHPIAAVGLASLLGALVITTRPWRWRVLGGSTRPLPHRLGRWLMGQVPLQAALGTLMAVLVEQATAAAHKANSASAAPSAANPPAPPPSAP